MLRSILAMMLMACLTVSAVADEPLTHTTDSLETVKENVKAGKAVIVDVREQAEWDEKHVAGAIHLPKSKLELSSGLEELVKQLDKSKTIYTHCGAGKRALACGEILKKAGFDVKPLKPGINQLLEAGFEKGKTPASEKPATPK